MDDCSGGEGRAAEKLSVSGSDWLSVSELDLEWGGLSLFNHWMKGLLRFLDCVVMW